MACSETLNRIPDCKLVLPAGLLKFTMIYLLSGCVNYVKDKHNYVRLHPEISWRFAEGHRVNFENTDKRSVKHKQG